MTIKISLPVGMAVALLLAAGCKRNDPSPTGAPEQSGTTGVAIPQGGLVQPTSNTVATYPDTVPQSGTKQLLQPFTVYQAADVNSKVLTHVSVGQWINLKGSRGNWMLIEWPSGVAQMSPGWIEVRGGASDSRLSQNTPAQPPVVQTAPTTPPPPVVVDAGAPPVVATQPPPPPARPGVVLKPRTKK